MNNRYKIIISNQNLYKEVELTSEYHQYKIGTGVDCEARLRKDLFFGPVELLFVKNNAQWSVFCSDNLYLSVGDVRKLMNLSLRNGDIIDVKYQDSDITAFTIEFLIDFDNGKIKYERVIDVANLGSISIGANAGNNIVLGSTFINNDMVSLLKKDDGYQLKIGYAQYGVYHNGKKALGNEVIKNGDFFSLSDYFFYYKDGKIWTQIRADMGINGLSFKDCSEQNSYPKFNRNTRIKAVINDDKIEILDPSAKPQAPKKGGLLTKLLPSLTMVVSSMAMAFSSSEPNLVMLLVSFMSVMVAILTLILNKVEGKKDYNQSVKERIDTYNAYIAQKRKEIENLRAEEHRTREEIFVSQEVEKQRFGVFSSDLFDRSPADEDFLCVRLGSGLVEATREINYKKQEKLEVGDDLQQMPEKLSEEYKYIKNAPIVCDLKEANAIGIVGDKYERFEIMKNIVVDIAARQYFSDVKMIFVAEKRHAKNVRWLRMLPHAYSDEIGSRLIVTDDESKNLVFEYLYKELSYRKQEKKFDNRIVVFFHDEYGFQNHPISRFVDEAKDLGVIFVFFGNTRADVPMGCSYIIDIQANNTATLVHTEDRSKSEAFTYPKIDNASAAEIVRILAPVYTEEISLESSLTKSISLFEMLNILAVDDIDLDKRWQTSQVFKSMSAPLGVSKTGTVYLDLHDKAHGPHGLVAGTTGSGKSEILQTYILSMATLFHPYEVGFVIIDFKGGGMANQFRDLPHMMGAITNIDGKEINRSLKSIKAELQKRQRLFAEADVNHIDKYIKKYKAGEVEIPLPHLIIVVDEFAELKAEQPEFMKELISAARIGRSLGVHLILATQKPAGQVNEQIWSNSRFKLCLKVQSQEDSNEVLKSPLAAEIKEPGRAYLQVGNNEIFELFQSAYSGAPEKMGDSSIKEFAIYSLSSSGKKIPVYIQKKEKVDGASVTQLDAVVNYVAGYCKNMGVKRLPSICQPPLEDYLAVPKKIGGYALDAIPLGIYDDPDSQYQGLAKFNICEDNTLIIGAAQTGKTNLIQSIIRAVSSQYSPNDAVFYIADFGAMYLKNFESLHHVGGVVTISESEKFKNLLKLLTGEIQYRKSKFLDRGISSFSAYREAGFSDLPQIFFVIDNFSAFKEVYADEYEDQFIYLTREGLTCGISIIVTSATTNGLGYRYMSNFGCRLAFKCNDDSEYMNIFDRCRLQPKDVPGRMLCKINKEIFEMQSFIAFEGEKEIERSNEVKNFIQQINAKYSNTFAKKIPSIPEDLTFDYIDANYNFKASGYQYPIALDYANVDIVALDFKAWNEFCIIGKDTDKKLAIANSILSAIHHDVLRKPVKMYIIDGVERRLKSKSELGYVEKYTIDYSEISNIFDNIMPEIENRYQMMVDGDLDQLEKSPQIVIVINNKDVIEYISSNKELFEIYTNIVKQFKGLRVAFIYTDVDDASVSYSGPELLKRLRDNKKAIISNSLQEFKFCDIPSNAIRNNKTINVGDVFLLDGSDVIRMKLAEGV